MLDFNLNQFGLSSKDLISCEIITNGHINQTFKLKYPYEDYIVQIVNSDVFQSVKSVMSNISVVCEHLKDKNIPTLEYILTKDGLNYTINSQGKYIRVCKYVKNSISLEFSNDLKYIYNAGSCFGEFISNIADIPNSSIIDTIPNFHDTKMYLDRVFNINTSQDKIKIVENLLNDIYHLKDYSNITQSTKKSITHNDVKFTNVLFNHLDKSAICVIDLDTIMNGYISYDFADGVRSICRNADNTLNLDKFFAYSKGFLKYPITIEDKSILIDSIIAISLELSCRYLYEYLTNGNYFHLSNLNDNVKKSLGYIKFAKDVISKKDYLKI